jgi:hypothetical protein
MNPRRAALVGLVFLAIAGFYWAAPTVLGGIFDYAGFTMLIALGVATAIMAYVLIAGLQRS